MGLAVHVRRKHGNIEQLDGNMEEDSRTCEFCDITFNSEKFTEFHIRREHELEDWKYAKRLKEPTWCSICDFKVTDIEAYDRHMSYKHS